MGDVVRVKSVDERLAANETRGSRTSHIEIASEATCLECPDRPCTRCCPAGTYDWSSETSRVVVRFENCLECGACRAVCPLSNIRWRPPMGGFGICYRYG